MKRYQVLWTKTEDNDPGGEGFSDGAAAETFAQGKRDAGVQDVVVIDRQPPPPES